MGTSIDINNPSSGGRKRRQADTSGEVSLQIYKWEFCLLCIVAEPYPKEQIILAVTAQA